MIRDKLSPREQVLITPSDTVIIGAYRPTLAVDVSADCGGGSFTTELPDANSSVEIFHISRIDQTGHVLTITCSVTGQTINNGASFHLYQDQDLILRRVIDAQGNFNYRTS